MRFFIWGEGAGVREGFPGRAQGPLSAVLGEPHVVLGADVGQLQARS